MPSRAANPGRKKNIMKNIESLICPYPIGTTVYCLQDCGILAGHIIEQTVCGYSTSEWQGSQNQGKDSNFMICHNSYNVPQAWQLKNVFPNFSEANIALNSKGKI
jgi:hypothetical protein